MLAVPFDPSLIARFIEASKTSTARMESGVMTDWLAMRWGIDADGLVVYSRHYAQTVVETQDVSASTEELLNAFVSGFSIALELVSGREAAQS